MIVVEKMKTIVTVASFRKFLQATSGVAAIEFAFVAIILVSMLLVATDFGLAANRKMQVQSAAQAGAQYAMLNGYKPVSIESAVKNATSYAGIQANPAPIEYCGCPLSSSIEVAACGTPCADGSSAGTYVAVSATGTYQALLPSYFMPKNFAFSSTSTVRIK
jgi:Flp pilus assembly pilin Flp